MIIIGAICVPGALICYFCILINNDYEKHLRATQYSPCESCCDSSCVCDMGVNNGKNAKSRRREPVSGSDELPEVGEKDQSVIERNFEC